MLPCMMVASVVDLFCGAGGLTRGFLDEGFDVRGGFDIDVTCRHPYERNNEAPFIEMDISRLAGEEVGDLLAGSPARVVAGCAPCQQFSRYTQRGREDVKPEKWGLLHSFARIVDEVKPDVVTMENVVDLKRHQVFREFQASLVRAGYKVTVRQVDCREYGVPQRRKRLVVFAALDRPVSLVPPTHAPDDFVTVREAIGSMEPLQAGAASAIDPIHRSSALSPINLQRIRSSKPGGTWRDWDETLRADCHRKTSGKTYKSVYGRLTWDDPAPTITTQATGYGNGRFGHPDQDRGLSLREMALLQTFPPAYEFVQQGEEIRMTTVSRHIGNAVPVALGRAIARSIREHLEGR